MKKHLQIDGTLEVLHDSAHMTRMRVTGVRVGTGLVLYGTLTACQRVRASSSSISSENFPIE
jgi:hypothetical protein